MFDHITVLKDEMIEKLLVKSDGTYIDCTVGGGGHSAKIAKKLSEKGTLVAIDQDKTALHAAENVFRKIKEDIIFVHDNFKNLKKIVEQNNLEKVDGIIFDLGVSSPQFDEAERGFSYQFDAPLDMRMNQNEQLTAQKIVNTWDYNKLVHIFFTYGEERFSKQVARTIERERKKAPIQTTFQLVEIIKQAIPARARRKGGHPAKRIFQALRIAVNDELQVFSDALLQAARVTGMSGRIVVITFHSLEDRICKQAFKAWSKAKPLPRNFPVVPEGYEAPFQLVTKKPITASEEELSNNRRARSAKLRIVEKKLKWDETFNNVERWRQ